MAEKARPSKKKSKKAFEPEPENNDIELETPQPHTFLGEYQQQQTIRKAVEKIDDDDDDMDSDLFGGSKKIAYKEQRPKKYNHNENIKKRPQPQSLPAGVFNKKFSNNAFPNREDIFQELVTNNFDAVIKPLTPLPPITSTQNFNEIFQTKLQSHSMKDFKNYFNECASNTGKIECDGNPLLTDAHLYELSRIEWSHLETISIRACPNITPFGVSYIESIPKKTPNKTINLNIELMLHAHNTIENKNYLIDDTIVKIEPFFGKSTKKSIAKVLIFHTNTSIHSLVSSQKMIINTIKPSKTNSRMLIDYASISQDGCDISIIECANSILFKELFTAYHPQIIYLVVSNPDDILKCLFSFDCIRLYVALYKKQIRLIIDNNHESDEQFFTNIHLQLDSMSKSAHQLYQQFIDEKIENTEENDEYRRNHYLSGLLHVQTKCEILKKKLSKDQCPIFRENNLSSVKTHLMTDSPKHSTTLHIFDDIQNLVKNGQGHQVTETSEKIIKLVDLLHSQAKGKNLDAPTAYATQLAQTYYAHKLVNDKILDIYSVSSGKSYFISDIQWFCDFTNNVCNMETTVNRKSEDLLRHFRQILGKNTRMLSKRNFNKLKDNATDINFFQWLFIKWNITYPVSFGDQNDSNMVILFDSISSEPPVPLNTVWSPSWPTSEYETCIDFHLLHPCDESVLFHLYKLFPSQKLLLASKNFLLIQEGAIEILVQYHHHTNQNTDISITFRALNLSPSKDETNSVNKLVQGSFQYIVREYYVIIWGYLFKHDHAFKIEQKDKTYTNQFDGINGNEFMYQQWKHLALYHYAAAPTSSSSCSVCGLRPAANKSLYESCMILSPAKSTTLKSIDSSDLDKTEDRSGLLMLRINQQSLSYTGKHSMRPDGANSFEVIFLSTENEDGQTKTPILSSIQIGCLMNNFDIKDDERILFEYGSEGHAASKKVDPGQSQSGSAASFLDEIRNFGGVKGLKGHKNKAKKENALQELYTGLRLRIDILFTDKPNMFELVYSINDVPWARQTVKRKSTQTMFQPIIQSPGIHNSERTINILVRHYTSQLDTPIIAAPATSTTTKNPWKVGMRLEAKDRKNPNILAIANIIEVYEDNRIRINFDGWTSTFDYTVETDNSDLHPCGYWDYVQRVLYKNPNSAKLSPHFTFTRYDKPKSYDGAYSWRNYLTEKNIEPVPFECFNYVQTEGMTVDYFPHGICKTEFSSLSCRHYFNVRVKYQKMNTIIQDEIVNKILYDHHIESVSPTATTSPGAVLLPTPFDMSTLTYPCLKQFQNPSNILVHITCNHRSISPLDSNDILSGTHLMDTDGGEISKSNLNMSLITLCMLTSIDLSRNQKRLIAPSTSKLISNNNNTLDKRLIDYYIRCWLDLSAYITCFHSTNFYNRRSNLVNDKHSTVLYTCYNDPDLYTTLGSGLSSVTIESSNLNNPNKENQFGKFGECYYCCLVRKDEIKERSDMSIQKRFELIGDYSPIIFYLELFKQERNVLDAGLVLSDEFFLRFDGLEIIDIKNITIERFQLSGKNMNCLKNLTYFLLENNALTTIQIDFQYLKNLTYLKFVDNPFESLPLNCLAPKSLQNIEFSRLGRLTDIDYNMQCSSKIKNLIITESILTTLPQTLGTDARDKLTKLSLNGVPWWGYNGLSVNEVVKYDSFTKKFLPFLDDEELSKIYRMYDEDFNGVLTYSEINLMNAHMYRYIQRLRPSGTKILTSGRSSVEPTNISESDALQQDSFLIDMHDISGIPSVIFSLENLTELSLEYQGIKVVPDAIKNLKALSIFNLNYCIELETLSSEVGFLPLRELNLTGCVSLKTPPIEITRRGHTQTMAFLQRLLSGSTPCKRTKLMLVGLGGAGKTSLVRAFLESHADTPPAVTDGIDIVKWKVPLNGPNDFLEYSVWDFAGQSVYYHTHQFFLAKKAVYVLAWNIRLGAEHAGLDFWLSSICCHAPNAPIFVVGTHADLVSRIDLRQDDLKRRYPQIAGFFNVSTHSGENVRELIDNIIKTTLALPYMDEQIPKAWLNFEKLIAECNEDILQYNQVADIAHNAGVFDPGEVLQSVQFLHDLGSLQYFSSEHLKNYVVINPQWIINVMACIVSIKDNPVKNGRLYHSDISTIWADYDYNLHPWILKLTEAFDLTFPVPDQNMNLVPCLLPEEEPEYTWEDVSETEMKEMKIIYTFNYLPAGLFNRAQVRLFQFSDKSTIWRYGSLLTKNNHRAVISRSDDQHITIKIQGIRPDNILFLIHEVFERLVNESFFGVTYDIAFPCPDCLDSRINEPWQFSSSLINRAIELKAPSIQCHRFFHVASVTDLQALIPPDSKSNYDLHLEYSVRDLKSYKQNMAVDIVYLYPPDHIPAQEEIEMKVDPRNIQRDLIKLSYTVWSPESMKDFVIENHYLVIKEAKFILFGISTELVDSPQNKNLYDAFQVIINILRKPIIPILFGQDMKWKESDIGVALSDKLYVNMQNIKRYEFRMKEILDIIEQEGSQNNKFNQLRDQSTDVFISYCWVNSHDAVSKGTKPTPTSIGWGDPRAMKDYLEGRGLQVWMDITRLGKTGVLHDIVHGLKNTKLVIACVSDEYTQSEVCRNEFLFAKNTLKLPVILATFGMGDKWRTTEVGMCSLTCPQINFQFENPTAFEDIYNIIQTTLPKRPTSAKETSANLMKKPGVEEKTTAAYQELFELTQRKFLRVTTGFADAMNARAYPRLFTLDYRAENEKSAQELARIEMASQMNAQRQQENDQERDLEAERQRDEELAREQEAADQGSKEKEPPKEKVKAQCMRALCENEENWHPAGNPFEITEKVVIQNSALYLSRIMLLLKQSDLPLEILTTNEGDLELQKLNEIANNATMEVKDSYAYLRRCIMDCDLEDKYCGLKQCLMPSGKILWLCEQHQKQPRVVLVTGSLAANYTQTQTEEKSEIMKALAKLNERITNNEMPAPIQKLSSLESTRRSSMDKQPKSSRRSQRFSQQDFLAARSQRLTHSLIDKNIEENDNENDEIDTNDLEKENTTIESSNCSLM